jgi:hypothetical protein
MLGESRGLVVKQEDSQLSGCGLEPWHRIQDGVSKASYYNGKKKSSQMRHTKKKYLKNKTLNT